MATLYFGVELKTMTCQKSSMYLILLDFKNILSEQNWGFEGGSEGGWSEDPLELVCTVHSVFCVPKVLFISHSSQCGKIATTVYALDK